MTPGVGPAPLLAPARQMADGDSRHAFAFACAAPSPRAHLGVTLPLAVAPQGTPSPLGAASPQAAALAATLQSAQQQRVRRAAAARDVRL